jgi:hypothetical protein
LGAIKLIRKYFSTKELLQISTSNDFSVLYYNSEVWHLRNLHHDVKTQLMSASANAICVPLHFPDPYISFAELHRMTKRDTPEMIRSYKLCLLFYRIFNDRTPENKWINLILNQMVMPRQENFKILKTNRLYIGMNIPNNRFHDWLNKSIQSYKISCKNKFLSFAGQTIHKTNHIMNSNISNM